MATVTDLPAPPPAPRHGGEGLLAAYRRGGLSRPAPLAGPRQDYRARQQIDTAIPLEVTALSRRIDDGRVPFTAVVKALGWDPATPLECTWRDGRLYVGPTDGQPARQGVTQALDGSQRLLLTGAMRDALGLGPSDIVSIVADHRRNLAICEATDAVYRRAYPDLYTGEAADATDAADAPADADPAGAAPDPAAGAAVAA